MRSCWGPCVRMNVDDFDVYASTALVLWSPQVGHLGEYSRIFAMKDNAKPGSKTKEAKPETLIRLAKLDKTNKQS